MSSTNTWDLIAFLVFAAFVSLVGLIGYLCKQRDTVPGCLVFGHRLFAHNRWAGKSWGPMDHCTRCGKAVPECLDVAEARRGEDA